MSTLTLPRNRDAWYVIRGYKYQIDTTIIRWLDIADDQFLELERGEDIDLVSQAFANSDENAVNRILEQVKHLDKNVTLKSSPIVSFLANAVSTNKLNPNENLVFRFTTCAMPSVERPSPFRPTEPGIVVWSKLQAGKFSKKEIPQMLEGLKVILKNGSKPGDLNKTTWDLFTDFVGKSNRSQFEDFIRCIEWSTNQTDELAVEETLKRSLVNKNFVLTVQDADSAYAHLFMYVLKKITQKGIKRLSKSDLMACMVNQDGDVSLFDNIRKLVLEIEGRIKSLEGKVEANTVVLCEHEGMIEELQLKFDKEFNDIDVRFSNIIKFYDKLPPMVMYAVKRDNLASRICDQIKSNLWINFCGIVGSGKTHLCALVAGKFLEKKLYFSFRGQTEENTFKIIYSMISTGVDCQLGYSIDGFCSDFVSKNKNTIIIIDDLPRISSGSSLSQLLVKLVHSFAGSGVKMITTSHYNIPNSVRDLLRLELFCEINTPPFTALEAKELYKAFGCSNLEDKTIEFLHALTRGHPVLLVEQAKYLNKINWKFDPENIKKLFKVGQSCELVNTTVPRLTATVEDRETRRLLYRLCLCSGSFTYSEISTLAGIKPEISCIMERLNDVKGLWIQELQDSQLSVSPLIKSLGKTELSTEEYRSVNHELACIELNKEPLSILDVGVITGHYVDACEFKNAMIFLTHAYRHSENLSDEDIRMLNLYSWSHTELPDTVDVGIRMLLRGVQIHVNAKRSIDVSNLLEEGDQLVSLVDNASKWMIFSYYLNTVIYRSKIDFKKSVQNIKWIFANWKDLFDNETEIEAKERKLTKSSLIWLISPSAKSITDLEGLLCLYSLLNNTELAEASIVLKNYRNNSIDTEGLIVSLIDRPWLAESENQVSNGNSWKELHERYHALYETVFKLNLSIFKAALLRALVVINCEYLNNLEYLNNFAIPEYRKIHLTGGPKFIVEDIIGRQYLYKNINCEAELWLSTANATEVCNLLDLRAYSAVHLAKLKFVKNKKCASEILIKTIDLLQDNNAPDLELSMCFAELSVCLWLMGDNFSAFDALQNSAEILTRHINKTNRWKELYCLVSHFAVYFSETIEGKSPPKIAADTEYAKPFLGMFLPRDNKLADSYQDDKSLGLYLFMCQSATHLGKVDQSLAWANQGMMLARKHNNIIFVTSIGSRIVPEFVQENKFSEAIDLTREIVASNKATDRLRQSGSSIFSTDVKIDELLRTDNNDQLKWVEYNTVVQSMIPISFQLLNLSITDQKYLSNHLNLLIDICREVSQASCSPCLWATTIEVLDLFWVKNDDIRKLNNMANSYGLNGEGVFQMMGYIALSAHPEVKLGNAYICHILALKYASDVLGKDSLYIKSVISSSICTFWEYAITNKAFNFTLPSIMRDGIAQSRNFVGIKRCQEVLKSAYMSLGIPLPKSVVSAKDWIDSL